MRRVLLVLEMIKVEHTVFALPFAFLGAFLAARGFPPWQKSFWIVLAMLGARSAAMAFNRLADRVYDGLHERTASRALPRGLLTARFVVLFVLASSALFLFAAWKLNPLAFSLSPLALAIVFFYSYTKRFTSLSHLVLGFSLAIAPVGGWIAVRGEVEAAPFYLAAAVLFWVAGFDIIYACQDIEFDRRMRLYSLPSRLGIRTSLWISTAFHVLMVGFLLYAFMLFQLSILSLAGLLVVIAALVYEHSLVKPHDLSRVDAAFFAVNGLVSVVLFLFVGLDLCLFV